MCNFSPVHPKYILLLIFLSMRLVARQPVWRRCAATCLQLYAILTRASIGKHTASIIRFVCRSSGVGTRSLLHRTNWGEKRTSHCPTMLLNKHLRRLNSVSNVETDFNKIDKAETLNRPVLDIHNTYCLLQVHPPSKSESLHCKCASNLGKRAMWYGSCAIHGRDTFLSPPHTAFWNLQCQLL
jgi:hypothetical protein